MRRNRRRKPRGRFKFLRFIFLIIVIFIAILFFKNRLVGGGPLSTTSIANEGFLENLNFFDRIIKPKRKYKSDYIYLLDRETGDELEKKEHRKEIYPASLTKMMTVLVALENIEDLSEISPVDVDTYQDMVAEGASMAGFYGREPVTYRDLLYGTMLRSGGEAANSLAVNISGDVPSFVKLMNDKAKEIGLRNTKFTNPEGLHNEDQYTTAKDMGKLVDYALDNPDFKAIFTRPEFTTTSTLDHPGGILLRSTVLSKLSLEDQDGFKILGGKSGTTYEAGQCWATLGEKDGKEYIAIVMGTPLEDIKNPSNNHIEDTLNLYQMIEGEYKS